MIRRRRLRATANMRALVSETSVSVSDLIYPIFVIEGENIKNPIESMPGIYQYSIDRLEHCRFGAAEVKPTCRKCPVHCYNPDMRTRVRKVMRWAGPRMLLYHPIAALRHLLRER